MKKYFLVLVILLLSGGIFTINAQSSNPKKVIVLVEGQYDLKSIPTAFGRELANLLGHFNTEVTINGSSNYKPKEINKFDYVFYIGCSSGNRIPTPLSKDLLSTTKTIIWINSGFKDFSQNPQVIKKYGFNVSSIEEKSTYNSIKTDTETFTKGNSAINIVNISNIKNVSVLATAVSSNVKFKPIPYFIKSANLYYIADIPFIGSNETDRYLYFSDKLHDILGENHPTNHQCMLRVEDVSPISNPKQLKEIADYLYQQEVPFMVGVVCMYVNPADGSTIKLSDKPELVDALKYMVNKGASIVMHGISHQYKGISTEDAEFWNVTTNNPILGENIDDYSKKIELGINEFFQNELVPIAWETPHYMGTIKAYTAISKYFSTAVEQRMVIDNFYYGQYFPYLINKDLYGQKIYPENLGYVPLNPSYDSSMVFVNKILNNAKAVAKVRDGIACCFFHPFLNMDLLKKLVEGLKNEGYNFISLKREANRISTNSKIILTGPCTTSYTLTLNESFLYERFYNEKNELIKKYESEKRISGPVTKQISLKKGELYIAEGVEFHVKNQTFFEKYIQKGKSYIDEKRGLNNWKEARVSVCWNPSAKGELLNDQSSLISIFKSLNINVDTLYIGKTDLEVVNTNLLVVPFSVVDSLSYFEKQQIIHFVADGGNLITDGKNKLVEEFGFKFLNSFIPIHRLRDNYYSQETINWFGGERAPKFEIIDKDEVFAEDAATGLPIVVGRSYENGKILFFSTLFDPTSNLGYTHFPFALEYVKRYLHIQPVVKRENLEVYFDPGLRQNVSIENLVKQWVKEGIRIIHISGWHQYPKYNYDYERVIKLAHANGILVYAWLEPPQVNQKFWENHPEWREKNHKGQDVRPSWRYPIALTDENCVKAVIKEYISFLEAYDWDGANLAELYFEAGLGFEQPNLFTPMHPSACKEFYKKYGFSLKHIFNEKSPYYWEHNPKAKADVINYRVDKITELHDRMLGAIYGFAKKKEGFGVIVTFMDTYFSPEIRTNHGVCSNKMLELQKKYDCYLQPEDPQSKWSTSPIRYTEFGKYYAERMSDPNKLLVDLNILVFREKEKVSHFPTLIQTGIESYHLVNSASKGAPRFAIYSEGSCNPQDLFFFSYASSGPVKYEYTDSGYKVNSPFSFVLRLPNSVKIINVDGQDIIGYRDNNFLIPAGEHIIKVYESTSQFSTVELQPQLLSFTGNLIRAKYNMRQVDIEYDSYERVFASFNRKPTEVKVNGKEYKFDVLSGNDCFTIILPSGKHNVEVITGDKFTYNLNLTSLWSISAIAIYGIVAVALLAIMYLSLKLLRRKYEN